MMTARHCRSAAMHAQLPASRNDLPSQARFKSETAQSQLTQASAHLLILLLRQAIFAALLKS